MRGKMIFAVFLVALPVSTFGYPVDKASSSTSLNVLPAIKLWRRIPPNIISSNNNQDSPPSVKSGGSSLPSIPEDRPATPLPVTPQSRPASPVPARAGKSTGSNLFWVFKTDFFGAEIPNTATLIGDIRSTLLSYANLMHQNVPKAWVLPVVGNTWLELLVYVYERNDRREGGLGEDEKQRKLEWADVVDALGTMQENLGWAAVREWNTVDVFSREGNILVAYVRIRMKEAFVGKGS